MKYLNPTRKVLAIGMSCVLFISGCKTTHITTPKNTEISAVNKLSFRKSEIKKFSEVITKEAVSDEGLFTVHKVKDKYYFEIPDSLLEKEMLLVSRIAGSTQNLSFGGAGQKARGQQVVRWKRKDNKILLRHVSYSSVADETNPVYKSVVSNNFEPVIYSFDIEALSKDSAGSVIEVSKLYTTDVALISGLNSSQRANFKVRKLDSDRSFIDRITSYPKNIEVRHVLTYDASNPPDDSETNTISLEMNQSMILLPAEKAIPRNFDRRVGFYSLSQYDYGSDEQKAAVKTYVTRWKLIPKDKEAYLRGELVEPVEPIVFYLDPGTPVKWRTYLKQGIEDWQIAFEEAGFKNAIVAKDSPTTEEDPEFSPEDVRYSVIRYVTNPIQNAQGPHVHDPRTGQILESDILWYHNVMNLLRNWYFIQTAAANPEARSVKFSDEVMGELIRFVSSHEVGHTFGLSHNFGSSYAYTIEQLRDPEFTSTHGTAASIMDYARFNYVAQPGDGVTSFHPVISEYDKWAIKWGYTWFPDIKTADDEKEILNTWIIEKADDPVYFYGRQTSNKIDPRSQNEDLTNNAMKAGELGMANLQYIMENMMEWIKKDGENYDSLDELYAQILIQKGRYVGHVTRNIGGVYENNKTFEQKGAVYTPVDEKTQKEAMAFLQKFAFTSPGWEFNEDILSRINQSTAIETFRANQEAALKTLLDPQRIARLIEFERRNDSDTYKAFEMMDDTRNGIWSEVRLGKTIDVHRRNLQRAYLERMEYLMTEELPNIPSQYRERIGWTQVKVSQSDIRPIVRNELNILNRDIKQVLRNGVSDRATRVHLEDASARIETILDPEN